MAQPAITPKVSRPRPREAILPSPSAEAFALGVFDLMQDAVIVVDRFGVVQAHNFAGQKILSGRSGLRLDADGRLTHDQGRVALALSRCIEATAAGVHDERPISGRDAAGRPILLNLRPLEVSGDRFVAVFVVPVRQARVPSETQVEGELGATPMEAKVAVRLARGMRLIDIAKDLEVALPTVRGHLKQLYAKTGAHRQAELVCLVLSLAQGARVGLTGARAGEPAPAGGCFSASAGS